MDTPILLGSGFLILAAFIWVFCAYSAYQTAPKFGRRAGVWGVLGIFFGPIALMVLYVLPKAHHAPESSGATAGSTHHKDPREDLYEVPKKKHH